MYQQEQFTSHPISSSKIQSPVYENVYLPTKWHNENEDEFHTFEYSSFTFKVFLHLLSFGFQNNCDSCFHFWMKLQEVKWLTQSHIC